MTTLCCDTAGLDDQAVMENVITLAFSADPIVRWSFPDPSTYLAVMPRIVRYFGGRALEHGSAWRSRDGRGAVMLLPPGIAPDFENLFALNQQYVPAHVLTDLTAVYEALEQYHPARPHWHLAWAGVDPACQGQGLGTRLVRHALEHRRPQGPPVYLESSSPRNIDFYQRLGFELLGTIQAGDSPPMFPMLYTPGPDKQDEGLRR